MNVNIGKVFLICMVFASAEPAADVKIKWGEQYASPGVKLNLKETGRSKGKKDSAIVTYSLIASNFPRNTIYHIWTYPLAGDQEEFPIELIVNDAGKMVFKYDSSSLESMRMEAINYTKGEPYRVALISEDQSIKAFAKAYPFPIEAVSEFGCKIWAELTSSRKDSFMIFGEGFIPNEELTIRSQSDGEVLEGKVKVNQDSRFNLLYLPAVRGSKGNVANYQVTGEACNLSIEVEWGMGKKKGSFFGDLWD